MQKLIAFFLLSAFFLYSTPAHATVVVVNEDGQVVGTPSKKQLRKMERQERQAARWSKKIEKKLEKQAGKGKSDVMDDARFQFGGLLFLGGLVIAILLGGIVGVLAGLVALAGLVLMALALLDQY